MSIPYLRPMHRKHIFPYMWMCVLIFFVLCPPGLSTPNLDSTGSITIDCDAGIISLDSTFTASLTSAELLMEISIDVTEIGFDRLDSGFAVTLFEDIAFSTNATFALDSATFTRATFKLETPLLDSSLLMSLSGMLEPDAIGATIDLTALGDSIIRSLNLSFNLDSFGTLQTASCVLPFTCAEARFVFPLDDCETDIDAGIRFDCAGFSELNLSVPHVGGLPFGISFGAFLTFTADDKTLEIAPSVNLENPDCFDFYVGVDWDAATNTLSELCFYGLGVRCEIGGIQFRMLYALDPSTLALVKAPYKSLLGLVWPRAGCCGQPGEGSLAFFFGEDNLFDLGEIDAEIILPVSNSLTLALNIEYPMIGLPTFTFRWQFALN